MTISEDNQPVSDRPARHCEVCGARVSESAQTCLICGADLADQVQDVETPQPEKRQINIIRLVILVLVAIIVLIASVIIGFKLNAQLAHTELPTMTPTLTATPTITPSPSSTPTATPTQIIPTATPQPPEIYIVKEGDTPSGIAESYGLTTEELLSFNDLTESDIIVVGQQLLIPLATPTPGPTPTLIPGEPTATMSPFVLHTVKAGDSLSSIAEEYGIPIAIIKVANDIPPESDAIQLAQVLTIPLMTPTPESQPAVVYSPTPTPGVMSYQAPLMLYPPDEAVIAGADTTINLLWSTVGILDQREYYNVEVILTTETERTTYNIYIRSTSWRIPQDWLPDENVNDIDVSWRVHIVRQVTENNDGNYKIISTTTARRNFTWVLTE